MGLEERHYYGQTLRVIVIRGVRGMGFNVPPCKDPTRENHAPNVHHHPSLVWHWGVIFHCCLAKKLAGIWALLAAKSGDIPRTRSTYYTRILPPRILRHPLYDCTKPVDPHKRASNRCSHHSSGLLQAPRTPNDLDRGTNCIYGRLPHHRPSRRDTLWHRDIPRGYLNHFYWYRMGKPYGSGRKSVPQVRPA